MTSSDIGCDNTYQDGYKYTLLHATFIKMNAKLGIFATQPVQQPQNQGMKISEAYLPLPLKKPAKLCIFGSAVHVSANITWFWRLLV